MVRGVRVAEQIQRQACARALQKRGHPGALPDEYFLPPVVKLDVRQVDAERRAQGSEVGSRIDLAALVAFVVMVHLESRLDGSAVAAGVRRPAGHIRRGTVPLDQFRGDRLGARLAQVYHPAARPDGDRYVIGVG